jgi:NADH dehydrogenase FAD-containing subunit
MAQTYAVDKGRRKAAARITFRIWIAFYRSLFNLTRPFVDLGIRLYLAQAFVIAGVAAMSTGSPTHNVGMMSATVMMAGGSLAGLFISLGLFTRLSSATLLLQVVAAHGASAGAQPSPFVIALLGWYVLHGPDALSIDRALFLGIRASALPFSAPVMRVLERLRAFAAPSYLTLVRIWLALAVVGFSFLPDWAHIETLAILPRGFVLGAALLLACGFALPVLLPLLVIAMGGMQAMGYGPGAELYLLLLLAVLFFHKGGFLTIDGGIASLLHERFLFDRPRDIVPADWPHVVIVGAGFGGLACASRLRALPVRVTLVDRNNYHLFQPLLYQVATAGLSPADVATPIRGLFLDDRNVSVRLGTVTGVDTQGNRIEMDGETLGYDYLVLATGAAHSYFGRDEWARFAPGLKRIEDGVAARGQVLKAFERAEAATDPEEQRRLLTFVVIGGGPTGVELAGAIAELARVGLSNHYRSIDPANARIILIQAGDRILPSFPAPLSERAAASLTALGVELRVDSRVTEIDDYGVSIGTDRIGTATVLWAAGVVASPAAKWLSSKADGAGRIVVGDDLRVAGYDNVYAVGDTAASNAWDGRQVPGLAPAAKQGGMYVAGAIRARLEDGAPSAPFRYRHMGSLATIGRKSAVADFGFVRISGTLAWWLWGAIHVAFLVGVRNRASVILNWLWCYLSFRLSVQLITGEVGVTPARETAASLRRSPD